MWQEITVGLVVAVSAAFLIRRLWNNYIMLKSDGATQCSSCSSCGHDSKQGTKCHLATGSEQLK